MYNAPYGDTQQLNLDWFIKRWKEFYAEWQAAEAGIDGALDAEIEKVENAMQDLYAARDAAAASATAAAASAASASTDATTASNAATAAAASATLANNKAAAAGLSEANAAQSATNASNSASAAATSASQANASESAATASAQAASTSETNAASSASDAADSATAAAASAQTAEDVLDSIPEDYSTLSNAVSTLQPAATSADIGKALIVKTVADGKASEYEFGEAGGGGNNAYSVTDFFLKYLIGAWFDSFNYNGTFTADKNSYTFTAGNASGQRTHALTGTKSNYSSSIINNCPESCFIDYPATLPRKFSFISASSNPGVAFVLLGAEVDGGGNLTNRAYLATSDIYANNNVEQQVSIPDITTKIALLITYKLLNVKYFFASR